MLPRPFKGADSFALVLPPEIPELAGVLPLLKLGRAELAAELGAPAEFVTHDPGFGPRWLLVLDPDHDGPPTLRLDSTSALLESRATSAAGLLETFQLLRTMRRVGRAVTVADCQTIDQAIDRVAVEVADTYPSFGLRGIDWEAVCARHAPRVRAADDPVAAIEAWLAELHDAHTRLWGAVPPAHLPYTAKVEAGGVWLTRVPIGSTARDLGVRPGWRIVGLDDAAPDVDGWSGRVSSSPHARPFVIARRLLCGEAGTPRRLVAESPDGRRVAWEEAPPARLAEVVTWRRVDPGTVYLRIAVWLGDAGIDAILDAIVAESRGAGRMVLDLRSNPGGNLVLACRTRDRFLRRATTLGSIRYSTGGGELSEAFPLEGEPSPPERRWHGRLVVLTDPLTYSASEDFLLGLQGLDHVRVVGRPSGGGSGRPRSVRLLPGTTLTVSSALTYDRLGRCVEGQGIAVDVPAADGPDIDAQDPVLERALSV